VPSLRSGSSHRRYRAQHGRYRLAFANRSFRILWAGQSLSKIGDGMFPGALAVSIFTGSAIGAHQGVVLAGESIAWVLGLLVGGVLADRHRRKSIIVLAEVIRIGALAVLITQPTGNFVLVAGCAAMMGFGAGVHDPSYSALVGVLLQPPERVGGNALRSSTSNAAMMAGPALGGLLMGFGGVATAYGFNLATFVVSIGSLAFVSEPKMAAEARPGRAPKSAPSERFAAWQLARSTPWLSACLVQGVLVLVCVRAPTKIMTLTALSSVGHVDLYGVVLAAQSAGAVLGALLAPLARRRRAGVVIGFSQASFAAPVMALLLSPSWLLLAFASLLSGIGLGAFGVVWNTAIQKEVPAELLGRVYALQSVALWGLDPVSLAVSPMLVQHLGLVLVATGTLCVLAAALTLPYLVPGFSRLSTKTARPTRSALAGAR